MIQIQGSSDPSCKLQCYAFQQFIHAFQSYLCYSLSLITSSSTILPYFVNLNILVTNKEDIISIVVVLLFLNPLCRSHKGTHTSA
nr:hypothetical protein Iba_scaffold49180CG0010 [Ipomoea batatas]